MSVSRRGFFSFVVGAAALAALPFKRAWAYTFRATHTNTGTLNIRGYGTKTIYRPDGSPLQAGDIVSGEIVPIHLGRTRQ